MILVLKRDITNNHWG